MTSPLIEQYKNHPVVIWGYPQNCHASHKWIHYRFYHTFKKLGFDVQWLENKVENIKKIKKNSIIISERWEYPTLFENYDKSWITFVHGCSVEDFQKYEMNKRNVYLFNVNRFNRMKFTEKKIGQYITERNYPVMSTEK